MQRSLLFQLLPKNVVNVDDLMKLVVFDHDNIVKAVDPRSVSLSQLEIGMDPHGELLKVENVVVVLMVYQKNEPSLLVLKQLDLQELRLA